MLIISAGLKQGKAMSLTKKVQTLNHYIFLLIALFVMFLVLKEFVRNVFHEDYEPPKVQVIDEDCVVWHTSYNGMTFREEIRLLENDTVRLRQTVAKKDSNGAVFLVGQYFEQRS